MNINRMAWLLAAGLVAWSEGAAAHVSVASGPAVADSRSVITFSVGHGCEGSDTVSIDVQIPEEITSVRGVPNTFGTADVVTNDADLPTNVIWTKDTVRDADDQYYQMQIRVRVPDMPFTMLYFKVTQTCRDSQGTESVTEWAALPTDDPPADGEEAPPAASFTIVPKHMAGWNMWIAPVEITDLEAFFGDAQIVWVDDMAYSANETTAMMIEDEDGVTTLEKIDQDAVIWVKY